MAAVSKLLLAKSRGISTAISRLSNSLTRMIRALLMFVETVKVV
jgi:hypothetical protein